MLNIAILISITSKGQHLRSANDIPFFQNSLPSFIESILEKEKDNKFLFYIGYDEYDSFYDNKKNLASFTTKMKKIGQSHIELRSIKKFSNTGNSPTYVWNRLFEQAYIDNCDYFYQVGDDITYNTKGWCTDFIKKLENNVISKNLGVCGPLDLGYTEIITQTFVSRKHMEIFGTMFPWVFRNIYMDNWVCGVYEDVGSFLIKEHTIYNEFGKPRYIKSNKSQIFLKEEIQRGKDHIYLYLKEKENKTYKIKKRGVPNIGVGIFLEYGGKTKLLLITKNTFKNWIKKIQKIWVRQKKI